MNRQGTCSKPAPAKVVLIVVGVLVAVLTAGCGGGAGKLTIGIKYDQPGLSVKNPDGSVSGFDVDVATYVHFVNDAQCRRKVPQHGNDLLGDVLCGALVSHDHTEPIGESDRGAESPSRGDDG